MEILSTVFGILFPVFFLILLGIFLAYKKIITTETNNGLQHYIFTVSMPVMLFSIITSYSIEDILNTKYLIAITAIFFLILAFTILISGHYFSRNNKESFMAGLTTSFSNSTYIGMSVCYFAFGENSLAPAAIYTVLTSFFLIIPTLLCRYAEIKEHGGKTCLALLKIIAWSLIFNPFVIAPLLAMAVIVFQINFPTPVDNTISMIARTAAPMALLSIGVSLFYIYNDTKVEKTPRLKTEVAVHVFTTLVISPLVAFAIIMPLEIDPIWQAVFVLQSAMAPGVATYLICAKEQVFVRRNALIILYSVGLSIFTLSIILSYFIGKT